jgi:hypothetical protein
MAQHRTNDPVVEWLKKKNIPLTRRNYLNVAYLGDPPAELSAEEEAELPEEIQLPEFRSPEKES